MDASLIADPYRNGRVVDEDLRFEAATARGCPAGTRWIALVRYVLAVALPAGATVVQLRLNDLVGSLPHFILFYPTVLLVAILAGGGPGFVAIVVSALVAKYWFISPDRELPIRGSERHRDSDDLSWHQFLPSG